MIDLCALSSYIHDFSEKKHSSLIASVPGANCRTTAVPFYVTGHKKGVDYHRCYSFLWWMGPLFFVGFTKAKWPCEEKNLPIFWKSWYKIHLKRASLSIHLFLDDDEGRQILKSRGQIDQSRQFFLSFFPLPQKIGKPQAALEIEWDKPWEKSRTFYFCSYYYEGKARFLVHLVLCCMR